jgi:hypothetical protein
MGLKGKVKLIRFYNLNKSDHDRSAEPNQEISNDLESEIINDEEELTSDNEFLFDKNGMICEKRKYLSNKLTWIYILHYDDKSLLKYKDQYNASKQFITRSKFKNIVDNNGNLNKQIEYIPLGNHPIDTINLRFNQFPEKITEYYYDSSGDLSQIIDYQNSISFWKYVTDYKDGRMIKYSTLETINDSIFSSQIFKCLEFDNKLNCTKYKLINEDSTESIVKAEIEYYK